MVTLDEGADWYFVRAGDVFGPRSGDESPYPQFVGWRNLDTWGFVSGPVTFSPSLDYANGLEDGPDDFYLGVATSNWFDEDWWGDGGDSPPWPGRHIFGWVKLRLVEESGEYRLEQLESAVAVNYGPGEVPEAHQVNESVPIENLDIVYGVLREFLDGN